MPLPQYYQKFRESWLRDPLLQDWLQVVESTTGQIAKCKMCETQLRNHYADLKAHGRSQKHLQSAKHFQQHSSSTGATEEIPQSNYNHSPVFERMAATKYSVSWDAYQKNICNGLSSLQQRGDFVDMTLAADGHHVKVHQMVMSLVSPFIRELISSAACPHPVIFLNKVSYETLQAILQYAYTGEVVVSNDKIQEFLCACKELHVRGLENMNSNSYKTSNSSTEMLNTPAQDQICGVYSSHTYKNDRNIIQGDNEAIGTLYVEPVQNIESSFDCSNDYDDDMNSQSDSKKVMLSMVNIENESKNKPKTSSIGDTAEATLKYTMSNHGTLQLVLNRYMYCCQYTTIKTGDTMWRCINYAKKCPARIAVRNNKVVRRLCAHNHAFHDAQILRRLRNRNIFTTVSEVKRAISMRKKEKPENDENKDN